MAILLYSGLPYNTNSCSCAKPPSHLIIIHNPSPSLPCMSSQYRTFQCNINYLRCNPKSSTVRGPIVSICAPLSHLLCHEIIIHSLPETRSRHLQCLFHPAYQFRNKVETMFAMFPFHRCHRHPLCSSYCPTYTPTQSLTHGIPRRSPKDSCSSSLELVV